MGVKCTNDGPLYRVVNYFHVYSFMTELGDYYFIIPCKRMPRNRKKAFIQQYWTGVVRSIAIQAVNEQQMGYSKASKDYAVPKTTLRRRVQAKNIDPTQCKIGLERFLSAFSKTQGKDLVTHMLELERKFFGVTRKHF